MQNSNLHSSSNKCTGILRLVGICIAIFNLSFVNCFAQNPDTPKGINTIVIDAGHGGKDGGCSYKGKILEKHVALQLALKLGKRIEKSFPNIDVIYTRKTDEFIELKQRAKIANSNNADLFISIHLNANESDKPHGVETYCLGLHKSSAQKQIMKRENASIYFEEDPDKYKEDLKPDKVIGRALQMSSYLDQSIQFAGKIQENVETKTDRKNRGVKQAGFVVLYRTTMPSILVESGFLTNRSDKDFITDSANQEKFVSAIYEAFKSYKSQREGVDLSTGTNLDSPEKNKLEFKVQIALSFEKVETLPQNFKGIKGVEMKESNGAYKYFVGKFSDMDSARKKKKEVRTKGYEDAFIVGFLNGERISLKKAVKLAENN